MEDDDLMDDDLPHTPDDGDDDQGEGNSPEDGNDERLSEGGEEDTTGDDSLGSVEEGQDEVDPEREAIRARRRAERQARKEEQRQLKHQLEALRQTNQELTQRLNHIERRGSAGDVARIDEALGQLKNSYAYYQQQVKVGTESQNGEVVADAITKLNQIQAKAQELAQTRQAFVNQLQPKAQPLDPRIANHAKDWVSKHPWYDSTGKDMDSRIVIGIDDAMADEGWDPATPAYWAELSSRVKKYLPHRASSGYNTRTGEKPRVKPPVAPAGRSQARASGAGGYELSAERVAALKDAGLWDDPKTRKEAIKRYQEYDKENKG